MPTADTATSWRLASAADDALTSASDARSSAPCNGRPSATPKFSAEQYPPTTMTPPPHDALAASFVWWSLPFVLTTIVSGGATMAALEERSGSLADIALFLLICVTWVRPSAALMLLAHVGSTAIKLSEVRCCCLWCSAALWVPLLIMF